MPSVIVSWAGSGPPAVVVNVPLRARTASAVHVLRPAVVPVAVALAAAVAAGQDDPARLAALGAATLAVGFGASLLGGRRGAALGVALVAASQAAVPLVGLRASLSLVTGAVLYVLYARRLEQRTPFGIVAAGTALGCAAHAGWQTAASSLRPTPFLVAAVIFLWTPGQVWSGSIAGGRNHRDTVPGSLAAVAGVERTAAAIFAAAVGLVVASLVLAPRLGWPYAAVSVPAGACLLATTLSLRRRGDAVAAARAHRVSGAYLAALLAGLVLSTL